MALRQQTWIPGHSVVKWVTCYLKIKQQSGPHVSCSRGRRLRQSRLKTPRAKPVSECDRPEERRSGAFANLGSKGSALGRRRRVLINKKRRVNVFTRRFFTERVHREGGSSFQGVLHGPQLHAAVFLSAFRGVVVRHGVLLTEAFVVQAISGHALADKIVLN